MRKICKRGCVYVLVAVITFSTVCMSYNRASTVKAFVGVDDVTIMLVLAFLAAGGCAVSYSWVNDGNNALDLADDYQDYYEKERLRLIEGGGGNDFDPNNLPEWDKLLISASATGAVKLTEQMFTLAQQYASSNMYSKLYGIGCDIADKVHGNVLDEIDMSTLPAFTRMVLKPGKGETWKGIITVASEKPLAVVKFLNDDSTYFAYPNGFNISYTSSKGYATVGLYGSLKDYSINGTTIYFQSMSAYLIGQSAIQCKTIALPNSNGISSADAQIIYNYYFGSAKENIWVHPDIQNDYKNDGKFDVYPPYNPLQLPTEKLLQALQQAMDDADNLPDEDARNKAKEDALRDYFNDIGVNKDPTQDPATDPDKPVDPDLKPDPNPDPDNPVDPDNPDNPDNPDEPGSETDTKPFLADLKDLFPFCIPFDLIHAIKILNAKGEPPRWVIPINYPSVGLNEELVIDFSDAENVVVVIRVFETLGFIVALICATRALIKG